MNFDEYIKEVEKFSDDDVVNRLRKHLSEWKLDDSNVIELASSTERFFGNSWIESEEIHGHLYGLWTDFKKVAVEGIGGMTVNEMLYWFGLFERYEGLQSAEEKKVIYAKLCANT